MLTPATLLPLIVSIALAPAPVRATTQADHGARVRSIEITHAFRARRIKRKSFPGGQAEPWILDVADPHDRASKSAVFFRDRPAPPLRDAPQDDAAAYLRTIDLGRRQVTRAWVLGYFHLESFSSPLEDLGLRVRPTFGDAALIAGPHPGLDLQRALEVSLVDARLPHLVAFLDGEPCRLNASAADFSVIPELHAMAHGTSPSLDRRPHVVIPGVLCGVYWDQIRWEPIERTVTCVVDADGHTVQRTTETPLDGVLALEFRRPNARIRTHQGLRKTTGESIETVTMETCGTLSLTVDVRSGEAVALCLDLFCQIDRTREAPEVKWAGSSAEEWEGTVTLRFASAPYRHR